MELVANSIADIILVSLVLLNAVAGMIGRPMRLFIHVIFSVVIVFSFIYGADLVVASVPAFDDLGLEERGTRAIATALLVLVAVLLSWLLRRAIEDRRRSTIDTLIGSLLGLLRGSLLVWTLILTSAYMPKSWGAELWTNSWMLQSYSKALRTTIAALPQPEDHGSFRERLSFDSESAQPSLSNSAISELKELFSKEIVWLKARDEIDVESSNSSNGMSLMEMIERTKEVRALARERIRAQQELRPVEERGNHGAYPQILTKMKEKIKGLLGDNEMTKDAPQDLLTIEGDDLTSKDVLALNLKDGQRNPDSDQIGSRNKLSEPVERLVELSKQAKSLIDHRDQKLEEVSNEW